MSGKWQMENGKRQIPFLLSRRGHSFGAKAPNEPSIFRAANSSGPEIALIGYWMYGGLGFVPHRFAKICILAGASGRPPLRAFKRDRL